MEEERDQQFLKTRAGPCAPGGRVWAARVELSVLGVPTKDLREDPWPDADSQGKGAAQSSIASGWDSGQLP